VSSARFALVNLLSSFKWEMESPTPAIDEEFRLELCIRFSSALNN